MRKLFLPLLLSCAVSGFAQNRLEELSTDKLYVKANAVFIPVGILNAGIEYKLDKKYTFQTDVFYSPWKSFVGHELNIGILSLEGRYYFREAFNGWYIGLNVTGATYKFQKWNYWKDIQYVDEETGELTPYIISNLYQQGYSIMIGATGGYQFNMGKNWKMDIFLGVGNSQDFYKGYDRISGDRYDKARGYNKSGEWIPYRGGIMLSYKLK